MKIVRIDSCKLCPFANYRPTDYYRNAYYRCDKNERDVTGNVYYGGIHESCPLENEPNSSNTVLCKPEASASAEGAAVGSEGMEEANTCADAVCPRCKGHDTIDIDDNYTKCYDCGFTFVG